MYGEPESELDRFFSSLEAERPYMARVLRNWWSGRSEGPSTTVVRPRIRGVRNHYGTVREDSPPQYGEPKESEP
jgi:hypothetical protein